MVGVKTFPMGNAPQVVDVIVVVSLGGVIFGVDFARRLIVPGQTFAAKATVGRVQVGELLSRHSATW